VRPRAFTVDASVFVNMFIADEAGSANSRAFVAHLEQQRLALVVPMLVLPEVGGAISRVTGDALLAQRLATSLGRPSHVELFPLDMTLARAALSIAAQHRVRGADAVYAAVARAFGAVLVSRDRQQLERLADVVITRSPEEALDELGG